VLKDPTIIEIARTMPRDAAAIARVRGVGRMPGPAMQRLIAAITAGIESDPIKLPREPSQAVLRRVAAATDLALVLMRVRCDEADLAPELVATRPELERFVEGLVTGDVEAHPLAEGWRNDLVGAEVRELVEGRIAIAVRDRAPFVDVIRRPRDV
jgi:ribonuclease D